MAKKKFILFLLATIGAIYPSIVKAQVDAMLTQHWQIPTLTNPAATGDIDFIRIRGAARLDMLGIYHAPKNFIGTADAPFKVLGKRIGVGIIANSRTFDLYDNLLVGAQGSYKFQIKKSRLSVGIQLGYYHTKFKGSELVIDNSGGNNGGDPDLSPGNPGELNPDAFFFTREEGEETPPEDTGGEESPYDPDDLPTHDVKGGAFDISIGIRYELPNFYVGISGAHLTSPSIRLTTDGESSSDSRYLENKLKATLYFETGGNIPIHNSLISLQPSLFLGSDFSKIDGIVEMRATYNQLVTFGVDYRYNRAVGVMAGISIKNFFLGYAWEYDYTREARRSTGNHEIVLGYNFKLDIGGKNLFSHRSIRLM